MNILKRLENVPEHMLDEVAELFKELKECSVEPSSDAEDKEVEVILMELVVPRKSCDVTNPFSGVVATCDPKSSNPITNQVIIQKILSHNKQEV